MAEDDHDQYNDEYQFADLDTISSEPGDANESIADSPGATEKARAGTAPDDGNIKRKVLIIIALVIVFMVMYKIVGSFLAPKKVSVSTSVPALTPVATPVVAPPPVQPQTVVPVAAVPVSSVDPRVSEKLSALESTQQSMRSEVSSVNDQLGGMANNVNAMIAKMSELNGVITNLSAKVDAQSREIEELTIRRQVVNKTYQRAHNAPHYTKYYLQAVIPGRAWLIATNGATLTVREGTVLAGYGMVRLIDPNQGRVTTSSGQVIRFSQEDS